MSSTELKSEILTELFAELLEKAFETNLFLGYGVIVEEDAYYDKSSDSEYYEEYIIFQSERKNKHMTVYIDNLINVAMSSKAAFRTFVDFIQTNTTLRFRKKDVYLHHNERTFAIDTEEYKLINLFFKFVQKVSFYKLACKNTRKPVKAFVDTMKSIIDVKQIDMSDEHGVPDLALRQLSNIFANLTEFEVKTDTFVKLLNTQDIQFSRLKRLKMTGDVKDMNKIVTVADKCPLLDVLEVSPSFTRWSAPILSTELNFAENAFPTVKCFCVTFVEAVNGGFTTSDIGLVTSWLKKMLLLTKAEISIKRWTRGYPHDGPDRYIELHNLVKSTDFGVPLKLTFIVDGFIPWPDFRYEEENLGEFYEKFLLCFVTVKNDGWNAKYVYTDEMPGKTFKHEILFEFGY